MSGRPRPTPCRTCGAPMLWHEGLRWWTLAEPEYMAIDPAGPDTGWQPNNMEPVRGRFLPGVPKYDPAQQIAMARRAHRHVSAPAGVEKGTATED